MNESLKRTRSIDDWSLFPKRARFGWLIRIPTRRSTAVVNIVCHGPVEESQLPRDAAVVVSHAAKVTVAQGHDLGEEVLASSWEPLARLIGGIVGSDNPSRVDGAR